MMIKTPLHLLLLSLLLIVSCLRETKASLKAKPTSHGVYIVYMGASVSRDGTLKNDHAKLLSTLTKRKENTVLHSYTNGFSGFAARLSEEEANSLAKRQGVVSVFPDPVLQLHTTHSWDFLKYQTGVKIDSRPVSPSDSSASTTDTIIGILDTGIWPESESFRDDDMGPIPQRWKGTCMKGVNFTSSNCNRKVIGARYYDNPGFSAQSPRDDVGHGTHVASTAAGGVVSGASYYGLANGTARGGSPSSRIAVYRVCTANGGCMGSAILKGIDDAIGDGVDVISMSLGSGPGDPDFTNDPITIGAFHAVEKGIIVVCSAGNSGPTSGSVVNVAPWIITVAGTSIDRDFETDIVLAGHSVIKGGGINLSNLAKSAIYPVTDGSSAKSRSDDNSEEYARNCVPGTLDDNKVKGKILLCENRDGDYEPGEKFSGLKSQGAIGMILIDNHLRQTPSKYGTSPVVSVTEEEGAQIQSYIRTNSNPLCTILPTRTVPSYKPAPVVGYFSSRGPTMGIKNLLKPDIAAPGIAILASWPSNDPADEALIGTKRPMFNILSGTSMSCPHVSGLVATVKAQHPTWSPSAISSAIMTTAIQTNNIQAPITTDDGSIATPYDIGAGEIALSGPSDPGLVYETEIIDYAHFLCNMGYDASDIKDIASTLPSDFTCPDKSSADSISNMNYPSIAISSLHNTGSKTVTRTVTNVAGDETTYTVSIVAPQAVEITVVPHTLHFKKNASKLRFKVVFRQTSSFDHDMFGSITWSDGKHNVRSPFVVSNVVAN